MTMIIVTHHMGFARELADRVIFMESGKLALQASPEEFFGTGQSNERIRSFLNRLL
jgi:polar amino acid transport system ATP-binding protein